MNQAAQKGKEHFQLRGYQLQGHSARAENSRPRRPQSLAMSGAGWEVNSSQNWPWEMTKRGMADRQSCFLWKRGSHYPGGKKKQASQSQPCLGVAIFTDIHVPQVSEERVSTGSLPAPSLQGR